MSAAYAERHARLVIVLTQFPGRRGVERRGRVAVINVGAGLQVRVFLRFLAVLRRLATRHRGLARFKFIHATTWRVALPVVALRFKLPLVVTVHGREVLVVPLLLRPLMRLVFRRADLIVGVSNHSLKAARVYGPRSIVAFNGISFPMEAAACRRTGSSNSGITILTICRLVERKNVEGAVRAVARLRERSSAKVRYLIAGQGPMSERVAEAIRQEGLTEHVELLGHVSNTRITDLYRGADIFLHPQITTSGGKDVEGFGLTIGDAMSFGTVVVVGSAGGPADFVQNGVTGIVVDGSDIKRVSDALEFLITHPQERVATAAEGQRWALRCLTWERHVRRIIMSLHGEL